MAKILFFAFFSLSLLTEPTCQSDSRGTITGTGDIVKQEITLEALNGVNLGFAGDVILTQGSTQKIVLEGQQNILDNIKREVKNGVWGIYFIQNVREAKNVVVHVTLPSLEYAALSGSGDISSTNKFANLNELELNLTGSGSIALDFDAVDTEVHLSGSGELDLAGSSDEFSIRISGSGDVNAANLKTSNCDVHISGSGDASVNASSKLNTQIAGSGDVKYTGAASVNARISGSGEVSKAN